MDVSRCEWVTAEIGKCSVCGLDAATQLLRQCQDEEYDADKEIMQRALEIRADEEQTYRITPDEEP